MTCYALLLGLAPLHAYVTTPRGVVTLEARFDPEVLGRESLPKMNAFWRFFRKEQVYT